MGLRNDIDDTERRIAARRIELRARVAALKSGWRERIDPRVLLLTGAAVGFVLEQLLAYRAQKPVVYQVDRRGHKLKPGKSKLARVLPFAQLAAARWFASRQERDEEAYQSPRSTSRAAHSRERRLNGLSRH